MMYAIAKNACRIGMIGCAACLLTACSREPEQPAATEPAATDAPQTAAADPNCASAGALSYVCGVQNPEDLVQLGDSDWLIVSGMSPLGQNPADMPGRLYLLNHQTKAYEEWFPSASPSMQLDQEMFGNCPGPLNTKNFSAHGLSLLPQGENGYRLYITSHGEREAIEVFDIDAAGEKPAIQWIGCVVLPEKTFANSVAALQDGGFVTTKMMDPTVPNAFEQIRAGEISGLVYEWHPGGKVTAVAGTELSGPNGIAVSEDQRWLFVAAFGAREIVRFDRNAKPVKKESVKVDVTPDNLRWSDDGTLYTAGGNYVAPAQAAECANPPCSTGWSVVAIDPQSMQATRVAGADQTAALQGASTALPVDDTLWIGTYSGDRVAYLPKP